MDKTPARPRNARNVVARIASNWPWTLVIGLAVFAATFAPAWGFVVLVIGLVLTGVKAAVSERVQELFKRKPDLTLLAATGEDHAALVEAPTMRPWPINIDRIVAAEVEAARATEQSGDGLLGRFAGLGDPFAIKPSQAARDRALETFREEVEHFATELREWLMQYLAAAEESSRTFELDFRVVNSARGAHAEGITLVLELPPGVEIVDEWPTVQPPPEAPVYSPPQPRSLSAISHMPMLAPTMPILTHRRAPALFDRSKRSIWEFSRDQRRINADLGDVHHGRTRDLGEPLMVRARHASSYDLRWTLFVKNSRRHCAGTITLVVPPTPTRPAFGTIEAIKRYPDLPFVDEYGEVTLAARTDDPPTEPPPAPVGDGLRDRMRAMVASRDWHGLGFDEEAGPS